MEDQISALWKMINTLWYVGAGAFGLCVTGFFYLMKSKDIFENKIDGKVERVLVMLGDVKDSLVGTLKEKGLKTMVFELKDEVESLKRKQNE